MKSSQPVSEKKTAGGAPDAQDTIKVVIRFKGCEGLSDSEIGKWEFDEEYTSVQAPCPPGDTRKNMDTLKYTFDNILVEASQEKMYYYAGQETVKLFTSGFNGTIFAYGMSGTGKTYSMLGPETVVEVIKQGGEISEDIQSQYGIIPRAIRDIFEFMNYAIEKEGASFELMMNYFEIYKESLNDLLQPNKEQANNLKMMGSKVVNSYKVMIDSPETIFDHIKRGQNRVHTEATGMNDRSSRSHSILVLEYNQINKDGSKKNAKLNLVDLAGSERIAKTGASGKVLDEAKKINLSLTVLGRVIQALGEGGNVPFRESTLTKLLKESLGGNSKTALLCTTSRRDAHLEETLQSLQFAKRVKKVKNKAVVSVQLTSDQMQALIVKLKQEVYVLRQRLVTANGSSFDKDLAKSDVQKLKESEAAAEAAAVAKADESKVKDADKPVEKADPKKKAEGKDAKEQAPKLSIETQREEVKAMLEKSTANAAAAEQVAAQGADAQKPGEQASPQMLQTPRKDLDRNMSPDKTSEKAQGNPPASPFKTPSKGPDDKSAAKEGHAFMQSFASDNMSARKSQIENPYSSFISLQSEFDTNKYFDQNTKVCPQQAVQEPTTKFNQEQFETLQELIQRQQVQLDSRNDLLIQRDTEIDRLYIENSQLTKNFEQLKEKFDNQAMDVYFKVAEEMNKQFKMYYTAQDSFQQMDDLIEDLKKQSENEVQENNKSLFTSISDIEKEMKRYEKWIKDTQEDLINNKDKTDKGLTLKDKNVDDKVVDVTKGKEDPEQNILKKENLESLQKIVNNKQQKLDQEQKPTNYNDIVSVRTALVNSTLTNLHVLHQYKGLLNIVQDNFMDKPRKIRPASPKKPIVLHEVKVVDAKDGQEPNSGINADFVSPTSVQMGQGSFKTEESKPTNCDTEKEAFVQVVPETQELISLKSQLKYQTDMYNEKTLEIKAQNELIDRLKRQHECLREQINRVDKENIKLKKKMDQDNLNKQQQYLNACQDPGQFQYNKNDGFMGQISNMFFGSSNKAMINKKVETGGKYFSTNVFKNTWQPSTQNQQGHSPAPRLPQQYPNNAKRLVSPRKQNTQVNTYEYSNNTAKKLGTNQEPKSALDIKSKAFQSSAKPGESATKTEMVGENNDINRDSQGSSASNKMQKVQLSFNKNDEAGSMSHQSNNSYRMAGENPFKNQEYQFTNPYGNSFTNGQFKYQQKPPTSPNKIGRFENNGPTEQLSQDGQASNRPPPPRVKKYTRQEIENRPGKYDQDSFYILPGGDFFDPQGFYFDKKGYDQLGGHYDEVTGEYIPGTEYAHLTMQKNQSYHAGDNRNSNKKNKFGTFDNSMHDDTQLRRNFGSFHAHQNNPSFQYGQQYSNFFPQKGGMHRPNQNQGGFHSNTQQDFFRRNTTNGVDVVHTPAKDKKGDAQPDQMSASSKNSFHGSSNFKSNRKPFKPTFTDDKPAETGPESSAQKDPQSAQTDQEGGKGQTQEDNQELLVTKL